MKKDGEFEFDDTRNRPPRDRDLGLEEERDEEEDRNRSRNRIHRNIHRWKQRESCSKRKERRNSRAKREDAYPRARNENPKRNRSPRWKRFLKEERDRLDELGLERRWR